LVLFFDINDFLEQQIIKNLDIRRYAVFDIYKDLQKAGKLEFILATSLTLSNNRDSAKLLVTIDLLIDFKTLHNTQDVWNALERSTAGYAYLHLVWDEKLDLTYNEDELKIPHIFAKSKKPKAKA